MSLCVDDYNAYYMLQLLMLNNYIVFCDHSTPKYDLQSYIVVAFSPANICACTGWGQIESWIMRLLYLKSGEDPADH